MNKYKIYFNCEDNEGNTDDYEIVVQFNNDEIEKFCTEKETVRSIKNQIIKCFKDKHNILEVYDIEEYCQFFITNDLSIPDIIVQNND